MGVDMKVIFLYIFLYAFGSLYSQVRDSSYIRPHMNLYVLNNQIITSTTPITGGKALLMYFDGFKWKKISNDTIPSFSQTDSKSLISKYTNNILLTGFSFIWEFDGKDWKKYYINDSLFGKREFREMIELPDSSYLITAVTEFIKQTSGNVTILEKMFHEVLQFKDGTFTTIKSRWTDKNTKVGAFNSFQKMKVQPNGNYSYYTPIETPIPDRVWELVTFNPKHEIVRKDTNPSLSDYGFDNELVEYADYLFDSKGSLWFITSNKDFRQFVGLVEKRTNGELYFYNDNIGIPKRDNINYSFDIDDKDNIWFNHTYRYAQINGTTFAYPSVFKLSNDKQTLNEYKYEELMEKSIWFNGGNSDWKYDDASSFLLIKYHKFDKSLLLCSFIPMLQFFPDKETTVKETEIVPIHLYPHPVQSNSTISIESSSFEKVNNPIYVILKDVSGATVREETISTNGNKLQLTTQDLLTGTYFVSVLSNNKTILQTKFIKE